MEDAKLFTEELTAIGPGFGAGSPSPLVSVRGEDYSTHFKY